MPDLTGWLVRRRVALGFACGGVGLWLAQPTWTTWAAGCGVAALGETTRVWAAGHLDKNREVTSSGPYRMTAHPLYLGSTIMGVGFAIAAWHAVVAVMLGVYLAATLSAAIRREERFLRTRFGDGYERYRHGRSATSRRAFSLSRAWGNREYRAVVGFAAIASILAVKAALRA
jgi:protein-S-isoprenylcysteine O-methyltransferase Ste14